MKVVLDTNVFVSAVFWKGPPRDILLAWRKEKLTLALSPDIIDEYKRVLQVLSSKNKKMDIRSIINLLAFNSEVYEDQPLEEKVCEDPDDDKFIACALRG